MYSVCWAYWPRNSISFFHFFREVLFRFQTR